MSRHALRPVRARRRHPVRLLLAAVLILLVAGAAVIRLDVAPSRIQALAAKAPLIGAECPNSRLPATTVSLTVAPELAATVTAALTPLANRTLPDRECVRYTVQPQEPAETVQSAQILPPDRAPDVWIPDSSIRESRVTRWRVDQDGSFATSPVVIATSQKALDSLGWGDKRPSWLAALAGSRPLAVPRIAEDAAGLSAVIALWQSLGKGDDAQRALAGAVLASGRAGVPTEAEAITAAESGSATAPLLPTSKQAVTAANAGNRGSTLVAVRPTGGSPSLDYPVLTVQRSAGSAPAEQAAIRERAVRAVVSQLLDRRSAGLAEAAGFEVAASPGPATPVPAGETLAAGDDTVTPSATAGPSPITGLAPQELAELVKRVTLLTAPSRILTVLDLFGSMRAQAGNGQTRIDFAATAGTLAGNLLTDRAQIGLWGFSRDLEGTQDIVKILDVAELGAREGKVSHRQKVNASLATASTLLGGNGTALFTAAVAGLKEMNGLYDPRAGNAVVLFTDGANSDPGGPSLKKTLADLARLYNPRKPVRLVCIGIGSGVDMSQLRAMAGKAGGQAYLAKDPKELPTVLFEAMNRRDGS